MARSPAPPRPIPRARPRPQPRSRPDPDRHPRLHEIPIGVWIRVWIASVITVPSRHAAVPATPPCGFLNGHIGVRDDELRRCGRRHRLGVVDRRRRCKNGHSRRSRDQEHTHASLPDTSQTRVKHSPQQYSIPRPRAVHVRRRAGAKTRCSSVLFLPCSPPTTALALCRHEQESDSP
jgi:hypothetical protein